MGHLQAHPIGSYRARYGLRFFVETGLWRGQGLRAALRAGFERCFSVEAEPTFLAEVARALDAERVPPHRYELILGDSAEVLPALLARLNGPALWWLDAHLPERYTGAPVTRAPLLAEVRAIVAAERDHAQDVLILDDLRLYGHVGGDGPLPPGVPGADPAHLDEIAALLQPTHDTVLDLRHTSYLVASPAGR